MAEDASHWLGIVWGLAGGATSILAVVAFGRGLLDRYIGKRIDASFDIRLADHKAELDKGLESHKSQLSAAAASVQRASEKHMREFSIYIEKKHEVYAGFYKLASRANDRIHLAQGSVSIDESEVTERQLTRNLSRLEIPDDEQQMLISAWKANQPDAIADIEAAMDSACWRDASKALDALRIYYEESGLYFSDEVNLQANATVGALRLWYFTTRNSQNATNLELKSRLALESLRMAIAKELRAPEPPRLQSTVSS